MASFLNYLLHSTILLSLVLVLIKLPYFKQAKARDILLKTAILISFISPFLSHQSFSKPELATIELPILAVIENKGSAPLVESYDATTDTAKGFSNSKSAQMNWAFIPVILLCLGGLIASFRFVRAYGVIRGIISKSQLLIIKGTDGKIRILSTPFISSPVAFGLNTILVPEHMVSQFSSKQLEVVLAHEMAHLKRQDPFWNGLFSFLSHTCFFQPLNFLALRIWRHTTEELCDADAVRKTHDPLTLAQSILQITQQANSRNLLTTGMVTQTHLRRRIEALLNPREITMKRWQLLSISVIPVLMALVLPLISFAQISKIVVLDAGHGGHDFGAVAGDIHEAAINLSVALKVKTLLEQQGITVIMTRDSDKLVEIESRVNTLPSKDGSINRPLEVGQETKVFIHPLL